MGLGDIMKDTLVTAKGGTSDADQKSSSSVDGLGKKIDPKGDDPKGDDPKGDDPKGDDPKGDDPKGDDPKKKNNSGYLKGMQLRVNQKHSQLMGEKEAHGKTKSELEASLKENADLRSRLLKNADHSDLDDDSDGGDPKPKETFTKEEVESIVAEQLTTLKATEKKAIVTSELTKMADEFQGFLEAEYADKFNEELGILDDVSVAETKLLASKFNQDPVFWLKKVKETSVKDAVAFLTGKPKTTLKDVLDKKEKIDLEGGSRKITETKPEVKGLSSIMKDLLPKIKK